MNLLWVLLGGAMGSAIRYVFYVLFMMLNIKSLFATLFVNTAGSFIFGAFASIGLRNNAFYNSFLFIGILGGFTTFSTFSFDIFSLLSQQKYGLALTYALGSLIIGVIATFLGFLLFQK